MRKWNLIVIVCLIILAFAGYSDAADPNIVTEPNDVVVDVSGTDTTIVVDANLIKAGDGLTLGFSLRGTSGTGQGKELFDIGYTYGVAQFYLAGDISKQKYLEGAVEFESRDIAEDKSVYGLSTLLLMFTPESYQVTGVAGMGYAIAEDDNQGLTIGGVNVRFNEDKNFCLTGRVVTALDGDSELRVGLRIKF